ncbi:hypothetical protein BCR36DRAFT_463152 [Piromyces finnis]|uniref:Uncharacterized protein n=1 Tax=Piromyces finnis TaxID=1754191 RepID=A0A1Y1UY62_9FUNG|nr:hypothetical protein BCR36DRAFT_449558 [Piromyces finnis]ORX42656.1 hypothetical protein BCR36DRAFT_463152 [Piromyces finnis]|eukprot:ORX33364.1 hypothetical protein BCR36DRAFT_449558 [Piromyces finnis]
MVDLTKNRVLISFDITLKFGSHTYTIHDDEDTFNFFEAVDFVHEFNKQNDTEIYNEYYDKFTFVYSYYQYEEVKIKGLKSATSCKNYSKISDFYLIPSITEIRGAYVLLNFRDPTSLTIEDDFYALNNNVDL